ncbi:MAG TPA: branched-chain amino acid ABC transporter permease [Thermodesulfobacteriota bacterium]|nr:branched-chain amino acid ABC transporter permease [Thermodesulfobacteriota bacterium]
MTPRPRTRLLGGLAAVLLALALPLVLSGYQLGLLTKMLIFAILAMSLDLLLGFTGLPSLGHAAYFGVAAYAASLVSLHLGGGTWLGLPAGVAAAAVASALCGLLALRTHETYFMMITLALAQVLWGIAHGWRSLTGGDDGLPGIPRPALPFPWSLDDGVPFYYFVLFCTAACAGGLWLAVRSRFGRALVGIRESPIRMTVLGYDVWRYRYAAFVLAGVVAGVAGSLFAYYNRFVSPSYLSVHVSATALLMVILGGAGTLAGPAVGAAAVVWLENVVSAYTERWLLVLGAVYVAVTLFAPEGVAGLLRGRAGRLKG